MSNLEMALALPDAGVTDTLGRALAQAFPGIGGGAHAGAPQLRSGNGAVLYLHGELGAGKTTCARAVLRALGVTGLIRSPTFTLVELYPLDTLTCVHVDLYRLRGTDEIDELGLRDFLSPASLLLIEWPEKGGNALPPADLELTLRYPSTGRAAVLRAHTALGSAWLKNLQLDTSLGAYVTNIT